MLKVPIDKILPVTEARANISKLVDDVEKGDIFVLTRGGKPAVVVASVEYIKKLSEEDKQSTVEESPVKETPSEQLPAEESSSENLPQEKADQPEEPVVYEEKPAEPTPYQTPESAVEPAEKEEQVPVQISTTS